ncbi:MAG: oxidoreductase [Rudaea sp.]|uniref:oxidoreductase n=1 Tax=Rudaea sp. TaxID=2136325 RepID=UPI0039E620D9
MPRIPIRVGLIGYGYAGKTFHAPLVAATPGLQLACVASSDAAKVHADWPRVEVVADAATLIARDDIDLVVIATPNDTHAPLARAALHAGKHVVVDKPFALDPDEARGVIASARENDRLLSVFHNRRWDSDFLGVKQAIADGLLGRVVHFESHIDRFRPEVRARWREGAGRGAGLWFDLGPHLIDQAVQLFGAPARVQANLARQREGALSDDWAHVVLDYRDGLRVILHAGMLVAGGSPRFVVHGERGSLVKREADRQEAQLKAGIVPGADGWGIDPDAMQFHPGASPARSIPTPRGDQREYYLGIERMLRGRGPNPVTPEQALAVMTVLDAAQRSALERRAVDVVQSA